MGDFEAYKQAVIAQESSGTPDTSDAQEVGSQPDSPDVTPTDDGSQKPESTEEALAAMDTPGGKSPLDVALEEIRTMLHDGGFDASQLDFVAKELQEKGRRETEAEMYKGLTPRLQEAAELRKKYEGQDDALRIGQALKMLEQANPAAAQQIVNIYQAAIQGQPVPQGQSPVQLDNNGGMSSISEEEFQDYIYRGDIKGLLGRMVSEATRPILEQNRQLQAQIMQTQHAVLPIVQETQESIFLRNNPKYNGLQAAVQNIRMTRPGYMNAPPDVLYKIAYAENTELEKQLEAERHRKESMPSRAVANALGAPGAVAPGSNPPPTPKTVDEAMDMLKNSIGLPEHFD